MKSTSEMMRELVEAHKKEMALAKKVNSGLRDEIAMYQKILDKQKAIIEKLERLIEKLQTATMITQGKFSA